MGARRDLACVFVTCALRNLAYGISSVILGLYLAELGLDKTRIGWIFTAALAGGALLTIGFSSVADRLGRRKVVRLSAGLMALAAAGFALTRSPAALLVTAALGAVNPTSKEIGPFLSIEQALLPQVVRPGRRTAAFAGYNMVASFSGALGALVVILPELAGLRGLDVYLVLQWTYAGLAVALLALYLLLSEGVEAPQSKLEPSLAGKLGLGASSTVVVRLAALFAVDALAGGFVGQSIIAYWLVLRYGLTIGNLGAIFFGANVAAALSFVAAAPIARRIGLLNTMVFTHLLSNVLLLLVPLMPNLRLAVGVLLARFLLSQLDVPTRQAYTMAIVAPGERSAAAGFTSVARNASAAIAPAFTGITLAVPVLGLPFLIAGGLKIAYDLTILAAFRHVRPIEQA